MIGAGAATEFTTIVEGVLAIGAGFDSVEEIGDIVLSFESGESGLGGVVFFEFAEVGVIDGDFARSGAIVGVGRSCLRL